jgi:hypothetical protein
MKIDDLGNGSVNKAELINKIQFYVVQYDGNNLLNSYDNNCEPSGHKNLYEKYKKIYIENIFTGFKSYLSGKFNIVEKSKHNYIAEAKDDNFNLHIEIEEDNRSDNRYYITIKYNKKIFGYILDVKPLIEFVEINYWTSHFINPNYPPIIEYNKTNINKLDKNIDFFKREKNILEDAYNKNNKLINEIKTLPFNIVISKDSDVEENKKENIKEVIDYLLDEIDK